MGLAVPVTLIFPGFEFTIYDVIGPSPLDAGGVKLTVAIPLPEVAVTPVGAPGAAPGITLLDGSEAGPVPKALVPVTVKV